MSSRTYALPQLAVKRILMADGGFFEVNNQTQRFVPEVGRCRSRSSERRDPRKGRLGKRINYGL
jgi:hypothetical protein